MFLSGVMINMLYVYVCVAREVLMNIPYKQGLYRLWNSRKTMEFGKVNSIYGKTMEFEQNGRTYGKTMEFSFWWKKKVRAFFKKNGGKIRPDFQMWFQCLLLQLSLH